MAAEFERETFVEEKVKYIIEFEGNIVVVENVPARVCVETGERLFSPETVELLQNTIWEQKKPDRIIRAPVFQFAQP
ncbi:MAG: hypothetical protein Kow0031_25710 [Anaerolineae bacterium]